MLLAARTDARTVTGKQKTTHELHRKVVTEILFQIKFAHQSYSKIGFCASGYTDYMLLKLSYIIHKTLDNVNVI